MKTMKTRFAALAFGIVVVAASSPSLAQPNNPEDEVGPQRAKALRECNARSQPNLQRDWGVRETDIYRSCMAEHGQQE
jgi:hypothetical protein